MLKDRENSSDSKNQFVFGESNGSPDEKIGFFEKGINFLGKSDKDFNGSQVKPLKIGASGSQELTLSYLCDNSKLGFYDKEILMNSNEKVSNKGKEIVSEDQNQGNERWVERDFLQLNNEIRGSSSKREIENDENDREIREKKPKIETLNLSLGLSDASLSLAASDNEQNVEPPIRPMPSRSVQSLAPSNNNTYTTYSNDFSANSASYSYSHPFSHNASCSLTRNSTEYYENSVGSHRRDCDYIWNAGEGTNGSVHSRFRPVGDGVALANHGTGVLQSVQGNNPVNKDSSNGLHRTTSSDNQSFFPSELPARPQLDTQSGDSRGQGSDQIRGLESSDGGRRRKLSRPERILREIVLESIPVMARIIQELPDELVESTKGYLKNLITNSDKRDELVRLQNRLARRSDFSKETLSKSNKNQLELLVALKTGLESFLSSRLRLSVTELVEIFMLERCRNVNCKRALPVEDCECKICSRKKGFCSECMCPVCFKFDCASNTCSWVGCDVCSHWCHAACGIQSNLIKPGPSLRGRPGTTEMQFHCLGCDHNSEMFGFIKDVFSSCAKQWGLETLVKELECVGKIFKGSEDFKGKELLVKVEEMLLKLENKIISPSDACSSIIQFFTYAEGMSDIPSSSIPAKGLLSIQNAVKKDLAPVPRSDSLLPKSPFYNGGYSFAKKDLLPHDLHQNDMNVPLMSDKVIEDEWSVKLPKKDGFESLESVVRIKDAEARMFQDKADEARKEAEAYKRMVRIKNEKLEEEYAEKLATLCLQETEERLRKRLENLKALEDSHCDYYKMKLRMQTDIADLLERMESTKQQWV
ncbi:Protein OBERON like [Heracleum sosnowskyi]|uniref:Protein OBERON like n=1 Tax=Heracleum sosnowskyi TaxID=360622 RepID=A0AAD8GMJ9_9APIA|nr:Protein OBERON like [Heracleum sosnowskyi]